MNIETKHYYISESPTYKGGTEIKIARKQFVDPVAELATKLCERWGIAGVDDGFDPSGRQKLRLISPEELVDRAFKVANLVEARIQADGHAIDIPAPKEPEIKS